MKEYVEIKIWHIVTILLSIFILYAFSTGYECGFNGKCPLYDTTGNINEIVWQGFVRWLSMWIIAMIFAWVIFWGLIEGWSFKVKNPFYNPSKAEAWMEYQNWLKERNKNK